MSDSSKLEIISNLKDRITQFKSSFNKNKEINKKENKLNLEINRDTLNLFLKITKKKII